MRAGRPMRGAAKLASDVAKRRGMTERANLSTVANSITLLCQSTAPGGAEPYAAAEARFPSRPPI